jgi:hypothetical protein
MRIKNQRERKSASCDCYVSVANCSRKSVNRCRFLFSFFKSVQSSVYWGVIYDLILRIVYTVICTVSYNTGRNKIVLYIIFFHIKIQSCCVAHIKDYTVHSAMKMPKMGTA